MTENYNIETAGDRIQWLNKLSELVEKVDEDSKKGQPLNNMAMIAFASIVYPIFRNLLADMRNMHECLAQIEEEPELFSPAKEEMRYFECSVCGSGVCNGHIVDGVVNCNNCFLCDNNSISEDNYLPVQMILDSKIKEIGTSIGEDEFLSTDCGNDEHNDFGRRMDEWWLCEVCMEKKLQQVRAALLSYSMLRESVEDVLKGKMLSLEALKKTAEWSDSNLLSIK